MRNRTVAFWVLIGGILLAGVGVAANSLVSGVETSILDHGSQTAARASLFWPFEAIAVLCRAITLVGVVAFGYAAFVLWRKRTDLKNGSDTSKSHANITDNEDA